MSTADDEIAVLLDELRTLTDDTQKLVRHVAHGLDLLPLEMQSTISDVCSAGGGSVSEVQVVAAVAPIPRFRDYILKMVATYQDPVFRPLILQIHRRLGEIETSLRLLTSTEI